MYVIVSKYPIIDVGIQVIGQQLQKVNVISYLGNTTNNKWN